MTGSIGSPVRGVQAQVLNGSISLSVVGARGEFVLTGMCLSQSYNDYESPGPDTRECDHGIWNCDSCRFPELYRVKVTMQLAINGVH